MQIDFLVNPNNNVNHNYIYSNVGRKAYDAIANWIAPNISVINLACGNRIILEK